MKVFSSKFLLAPLNKEFSFLIFIFIMSSIVDFIGYGLRESIFKAIYIVMHHFAICYIITIFLTLLPLKIKRYYKFFIILLLVINCIIDATCVFSFNYVFDKEVPGIMTGTNTGEALEFLSVFITWRLTCIIIILFFSLFILYRVLQHINFKPQHNVQYAILSVFFLCILIPCVLSSKNWYNISLGKAISFYQAARTADLDNRVIPPMIVGKMHRPNNFVIVIGESFKSKNSSLYGYEKDTSPLLSKLSKERTLLAYPNVTAAGTHTIQAFKRFMTGVDDDSVDYTKLMTLTDVLHLAGYKIAWLSNQAPIGFYQNVITRYAALCDTTVFPGHQFDDGSNNDIDEILLPTLYSLQNTLNDSLQCYIIHLMGSHPDFKKRVPETYSKFSPKEYAKHGEILAAYDNTIAYNDSIMNEIIKSFDKKDTFLIYFSDHGLDLFDTSDNYFGHAKHNDPASEAAGRDIPFIIYVSPKFIDNNPILYQKITTSIDKHFNTTNLIYSIMDILNVQPADSIMELKNSLFY